jgi:hypothetical protein
MSDSAPGRLATGMITSSANFAELGEFYKAWGHRTVVEGDALWFDGGSFSMMSIPTTHVPGIGTSAVRRLLARTGKAAAIYGVSEPGETSVDLFMLRDKSYDLGHLQRQFRQHVRTAASALQVRECSWDEWRYAALRCDGDTLSRHRGAGRATHPLLSMEGRGCIASAAAAVPGLRLHACFCGEEIAAYLVHLTLGETCEGLLAHRRDAPGTSPARHASHLLYFSFAQSAIARPEISAVCVGRQSVPANEPLAQFKRHAGFAAELCHLRIHLHPVLAPFLENRAASAFLQTIRTVFSGKVPALRNLEVLECSARCGR